MFSWRDSDIVSIFTRPSMQKSSFAQKEDKFHTSVYVENWIPAASTS